MANLLKNCFVLHSAIQGEYVSPGEIEAVFMESTYVEECFVYGDSLKSQLVAIVFPNEGDMNNHV